MPSLFQRNRYSVEEFQRRLAEAKPLVRGEQTIAVLQVGDTEIELQFPTEAKPSEPSIATVLERIDQLDNLVQESNERAASRSSFGPENFDLYLAYVILQGPQLKLGYYGTRVNTEWDAKFVWSGVGWLPQNL